MSIDADDVERWERYYAFEAAFVEAGQERTPREMIEALLPLFEEAVDIHPGAGILVADRLGRLYSLAGDNDAAMEWNRRGAELRLGDPEQSGGTGASGARIARQLAEQGDHEGAADAWLSVLHDGMTPLARSVVLRDAGRQFAQAGLRWEARAAFDQALELVEGAAPGTFDHLDTGGDRLHFSYTPEDDADAALREALALYRHPALVDVPDKLFGAGMPVMRAARYAGAFDIADELARHLYAEAARFERELGLEAAIRARVGLAYTQVAAQHGSMLIRRGLDFEAMEVFEAALEAYPDERHADTLLLQPLQRLREKHGLQQSRVPQAESGARVQALAAARSAAEAAEGDPAGVSNVRVDYEQPIASRDPGADVTNTVGASRSGSAWLPLVAGGAVFVAAIIALRLRRP